jgi:hypothetical protein
MTSAKTSNAGVSIVILTRSPGHFTYVINTSWRKPWISLLSHRLVIIAEPWCVHGGRPKNHDTSVTSFRSESVLMTIQSKTRFGAFLLILVCLSGLAGCRTFNSLAGINSPTVPPPATGSYKIPGVDGATQPYYTPSGANGSSTPSGQWLPVQSRATTGTDSTQWAMQNSNAVRTVGYDSTPGTGSPFATSDEAEQVVQSRLAAEQADSVSSSTRVPDQITPSTSAQPLNPTPSGSPTIQPGMPPTSTLETPAFVLPTHQTQPVGSGVTSPPASIASPAVASGAAVPTSPPPSGNPQPTLVPTPISAPPSSATQSSLTSQSNPAPSQPASLPVVSGSTSFRPRVKSQ